MKYSVKEIDDMRTIIFADLGGMNASPSQVEDRLRTYMANGSSVEDLRQEFVRKTIDSAERKLEKYPETVRDQKRTSLIDHLNRVYGYIGVEFH